MIYIHELLLQKKMYLKYVDATMALRLRVQVQI